MALSHSEISLVLIGPFCQGCMGKVAALAVQMFLVYVFRGNAGDSCFKHSADLEGPLA